MPMMTLSVNPVKEAAILLPILVIQDTLGEWAFRRSWDKVILATMLPGMVLGIALGYLLAAKVRGNVVEGVVGALTLAFGSFRLWAERRGRFELFANFPNWMGSIFGVVSGFTSQIAHAGGPPFQIWVMRRRLPRDVLVGTTAIAFAVMSWIKIPACFALGQFTFDNLLTSGMLLPVALASTAGVIVLVRKFNPEHFYLLIYLLMVVVGLDLLITSIKS